MTTAFDENEKFIELLHKSHWRRAKLFIALVRADDGTLKEVLDEMLDDEDQTYWRIHNHLMKHWKDKQETK